MNTKEENLRKLVTLLDIRENNVSAVEQVLEIFMEPIIGDAEKVLDDDEMKEFCVLVERYKQVMRSSVDSIVENLIVLYDKYFTEEEISSIVEFYSSPAGLRMVELTPTLLRETMQYSTDLSRSVADDVFGDKYTGA